MVRRANSPWRIAIASSLYSSRTMPSPFPATGSRPLFHLLLTNEWQPYTEGSFLETTLTLLRLCSVRRGTPLDPSFFSNRPQRLGTLLGCPYLTQLAHIVSPF